MYELISFTCIFGFLAFLLFGLAVVVIKELEGLRAQGPGVEGGVGAGGNQYMGYQGQEEVNPWTYAPIYGNVGDWWMYDWDEDYPEEAYYDV